MSGKQKKTSGKYENWRIRSDLHTEIGVAAKKEHVPMYELAERAWRAYTGRPSQLMAVPERDRWSEAMAELTDEERRIILAVLDFLRDDTVPDRFGGGCFLKDYLKESKAQRRKMPA